MKKTLFKVGRLIALGILLSAIVEPSMAEDSVKLSVKKVKTKIKVNHEIAEAVLDRCIVACSASEISCITAEDHTRHNWCHRKREQCENRCNNLYGQDAESSESGVKNQEKAK